MYSTVGSSHLYVVLNNLLDVGGSIFPVIIGNPLIRERNYVVSRKVEATVFLSFQQACGIIGLGIQQGSGDEVDIIVVGCSKAELDKRLGFLFFRL